MTDALSLPSIGFCGEPAPPDPAGLCIRPIEPGDGAALAAFFARLSDESRHRRFLGPTPAVAPGELAYLSEVDHAAHEALAAVDATGAIVGEGRYATWPRRQGTADFAIAVLDDLQGRGVGTALGAATLARARANGVARLTASTLWENAPARALLRRLGFRAVGSDGAVLDLELALGAAG